MKNIKLTTILLAMLTICCSLKMYSQASWAGTGNSVTTAQDYLGWTNGTLASGFLTIPELTIKNEDAMPISFYTNGGAGTFANMRMRILGGYGGTIGTGLIGIGDMGTGAAPFTPQNVLHQHYNGNSNFHQFTNTTTGSSATSGFTIGINGNLAEIRQYENNEIRFSSLDPQSNSMQARMGITHRAKVGYIFTDPTRVWISSTGGAIQNPQALLHLGYDYAFSGSNTAWRNWMDIGTMANGGSDFMYVGLKDESGNTPPLSDNMDAVINWADNNTIQPDNQNDLRFIFTSLATGSTQSASYDGLEVARMTWAGNVGIGNYFDPIPANIIRPQRRLEVLNDPTANPPIPQFRLTFTQNANVALGIWTDFQTTPPGNLKINNTNSRVGIHIPGIDEPQYSMHIQGNTFCSDEDLWHWILNYAPGVGHPHDYTLAAKTQPPNDEDWSEPCFAIYSDEDDPTDRLAVNADRLGFVNFFTIATPTSYRDRTEYYINEEEGGVAHSLTYYGTSPDGGSVVMAPDFYEQAASINNNANLLSRYKAKLWVESNDFNPGPIADYPCIVANNTVNKESDNSNEHHALIANCIGVQDDEAHKNIAGYFTAMNANRNFGLISLENSTGTGINQNFGGYFIANGGSVSNVGQVAVAGSTLGDNYGGYFIASSGSNINYGVYSTTPLGTCSTSTACTDAAGFFNGALYTTNGPWNTSDATLKTNIDTLQGYDAYNILNDINVYSFEFDTAVGNSHNMNLAGGTHYGVLAQELEQILPSLVKNFASPAKMDTSGNISGQNFPFKAVNYTELIPVLIAGYKNQQKQIDTLIQQLNNCCPLTTPRNTNPGQGSGMTVELENKNAIILSQNDPNPFSQNSTIKWSIPIEEKKGAELNAMLIFYDNSGTVLKTVKINDTGNGELLVYGSKLSSGIYTYSLVVNGKTISTKRMVKTN